MSEVQVRAIRGVRAHALALGLDLARARAGGGEWIARYEGGAGPSETERIARLILALAHGASGASTGDGPLAAPEGSELGDALERIGRTAPEPAPILLLSAEPESSPVLAAWHRSAWEAGHELEIRAFGREGAGGGDALRAPGGSERACGPVRRIVLADATAPASLLEDLARSGAQVLLDLFEGGADEGVLDSGLLVDRISRAEGGAGAPTPGAAPGPLLGTVSPLLGRAMELLADPAPAPRALAAQGVALDAAGTAIALLPGSARPAITREALGAGGIWRVATRLDAATRTGLLLVLAAHARLSAPGPCLPDGVEAHRRGGALLLVNHAHRARELSGILGRDLVSGLPCTGHVLLGPSSAMLVLGETRGEGTGARA